MQVVQGVEGGDAGVAEQAEVLGLDDGQGVGAGDCDAAVAEQDEVVVQQPVQELGGGAAVGLVAGGDLGCGLDGEGAHGGEVGVGGAHVGHGAAERGVEGAGAAVAGSGELDPHPAFGGPALAVRRRGGGPVQQGA